MIDYQSYAHTLYAVLFTNTKIKPCVRLQSLVKLAHILDEHIPPETTMPLEYLSVIEDVIPRELAPLSPDQIRVAINLLSVSRNPPIPKERPPDPIVQLCKLLVQKNILTSDDVNAAMEGTEISMAVTAHLSAIQPDEGEDQ